MEDCLRLLPDTHLDSLLNYMESSLPQSSIWCHHYIYNHIKYYKHFKNLNNISGAIKTKIYGPKNGKFENCTIIGMSDESDYSLFLFTAEKSASELLECISNTKLIDWNKKPYHIYTQSRYYPKINELLQSKGLKTKKIIEDVFYISKETIENFVINIPKEVFVQPLTVKDAHIVNEYWPYKYSKSLKLIESLIQMNGGTGLYKTDTKELIGWMLVNEYYCPGFLHVMETERRKGYGSLLAKIESKRVAENNQLDVCVVVVRGNDSSKTMFEIMGFKFAQELTCILLE